MKRKLCAWALVSASLVSPSSAMQEITPSVTDVATIQDGQGNARLLFHWAPTVDAANFAVRRAILKFDLVGLPESRTLRVNVCPLTKAWTAGTVGWATGWDSAGGDYNADAVARADLDLSGGTALIDVTNAVKEILEEKRTSYGYMLTVDPAEGTGFGLVDAARLAGVANATVELSYRRTPPPPAAVADGGNATTP